MILTMDSIVLNDNYHNNNESLSCIPRHNLLSRFNGTLPETIQTLRTRSKDLSLDSLSLSSLRSILRQYYLLLHDVDNSIQSGTEYNGHHLLTKLTMHPDEDINEEVAECITIINKVLPPGLTFPIVHGLGQYPPYPLLFHYLIHSKTTRTMNKVIQDTMDKDIFRYTHVYDDILKLMASSTTPDGTLTTVTTATTSSTAPALYNHLRIYQRCIPPWMHRQTSQDDVGQMLWPAAIPMSRWLIQHRYLFPFRSILEIGSGMGLCGILVALLKYYDEQDYELHHTQNGDTGNPYYAYLRSRKEDQYRKPTNGTGGSGSTAPVWPVIVSDFNPLVLHNLYYNTTLNEPCYHPSTSSTSFPSIYSNVSIDNSTNIHTTNASFANVTPSSPLMRTVRVDWNIYKENNIIHSNVSSGSSFSATDSSSDDNLYCSVPSSSSSDPNTLPYYQNITGVYKQLDITHTYDIILGSDMICSIDDCYGVGALLNVHLAKPYGIGIFMLAPSDVRWGVERLASILKEYGLHVETRTIPSMYVDTPNKYYSFNASVIDEITKANSIPAEIQEQVKNNSLHAENTVHDWVQKPNDIIDVVVAGGYEQRLQVHIVTWNR